MDNLQQRNIKIGSGLLDMEFEVIRTNAPSDIIENSIIKQENDNNMKNGLAKTYHEYIEESGYKIEYLGCHEDENINDVICDETIDIEDLMERENHINQPNQSSEDKKPVTHKHRR